VVEMKMASYLRRIRTFYGN